MSRAYLTNCPRLGPPWSGGNGEGQEDRPLVPLSYSRCRPSTRGLSTSSSRWGLRTPPGSTPDGCPKAHLAEGFALRCVQRFSLPNVATRRCSWRNNRHTSGSSVPVLSYWGRPRATFARPRRIETELSRDVLNPARVPLSWANSPTLGTDSSPRMRRADIEVPNLAVDVNSWAR